MDYYLNKLEKVENKKIMFFRYKALQKVLKEWEKDEPTKQWMPLTYVELINKIFEERLKTYQKKIFGKRSKRFSLYKSDNNR